MKKKILFVMSSLRGGGAERGLVNLLSLFDFERYEVDLILLQQEGFLLKQLPPEVNLISDCEDLHTLYRTSLKKMFSFKYPALSLKHIVYTLTSKLAVEGASKSRQYRWKRFYRKIIKKLNKPYDVGIAYMHCEPIYFLVDKVKADIKIGWIHNDYSQLEYNHAMDLRYFKKLDKLVSISDICVEALRKTFPSQRSKLYMLPNLTSSETVKAMAEEFIPEEFKTKKLKLLSIGRLDVQKGFDIAIDAASILKKHGIDFIWCIIGKGSIKKELENQIKSLGLEKSFFLLGTKENPYPFIKRSDIVVQTSRFEGKSVVIDEAKILAKPIVVTRYSTVFDQINEKEGIIVELNAAAVAEGIERMLTDSEAYIKYLSENKYGNQDKISEYYKLFDCTSEEKL